MASTEATEHRPLRADARRNRERIVQASREVFAEYGAVAQIDDIAARAGCGVGTLYRHFPNKDALVGELVRLHFERLADRCEHWYATTQDQDPWDGFEGFVRETAEHMATDVAQQRMIWESSPEAFAHALTEQERLQATGAKLIARAQASGAMREDFSVSDMPTFMCALGSAMLMETRGAGHDWRRLLTIVLDGVRRR